MQNDYSIWLGPLREVAAGLSERSGYARERALAMAAEIGELDASLREAFRTWWNQGGTPNAPAIAGYTPKSLIEQGRCRSVPVAFTWLNALLTDPHRAKKRIHACYDIITDQPEIDLELDQSDWMLQ